MFIATSLLFVPGSRPDRFAKAGASGADLTVIDLEDAVAQADKLTARNAAMAHFPDGASKGWGLRINAVDTAAGVRDLAALLDAAALPEVLLVPMVEDVVEVELVAKALGENCPGIIPLIETPKGLRHAHDIAGAQNIAAMMFGGGDFSAELGVDLAWEPLLTARQLFVHACAEHKVPAIDVPFVKLDDEAGLAEECQRARHIGFDAKAAIHPTQIPAIEQAFEPSEDAVNAAAEALRAYEEAGGKAIRHKGQMLEAPLVNQYRVMLARREGKLNA